MPLLWMLSGFMIFLLVFVFINLYFMELMKMFNYGVDKSYLNKYSLKW